MSQVAAHGYMFVCTCSFKREETSPFDVQEDVNLRDLYKDTLEDKADEPMEHPAGPSNDSVTPYELYVRHILTARIHA